MTVHDLLDNMHADEIEEWIAEFMLRDEDAKQRELARRAQVHRKHNR